MIYVCPKCGKHIELSYEALKASGSIVVCPQCLAQLQISNDIAIPANNLHAHAEQVPENYIAHTDKPSQAQPEQRPRPVTPPPVPQSPPEYHGRQTAVTKPDITTVLPPTSSRATKASQSADHDDKNYKFSCWGCAMWLLIIWVILSLIT